MFLYLLLLSWFVLFTRKGGAYEVALITLIGTEPCTLPPFLFGPLLHVGVPYLLSPSQVQLSDSTTPWVKERIPSDLRTQTPLGLDSTRVGDYLGTPWC